MNKYIKILFIVLTITSSVYLPGAAASSSTEMLITIAENNPVLVDRLNDIALHDPILLKQLLTMANSDPVQLERLLNLAESNLEIFAKLVTIYKIKKAHKVQPQKGMSTFGTIDDGGVNRN